MAGESWVDFHQPRKPKMVSLLSLMQQLAPLAETMKPMKLRSVKMTYITLFLPLLLWQVRMQELKLLQIHNSLILGDC